MPASTTSDDEDSLLESLEHDTENDPSLAHLREARMQQISTLFKQSKALRSEGYGTYSHMTDEKALMDITTSTKLCIVHFTQPDFNRCRVMDTHLSALASAHLTTRFLKINVEHAPFLVEKLKVRVLPCVIAFVNGVGVDRVVGFEGLSGDGFETGELERRLLGCGVLERERGLGVRVEGVRGNGGKEGEGEKEEDGDDEWD